MVAFSRLLCDNPDLFRVFLSKVEADCKSVGGLLLS